MPRGYRLAILALGLTIFALEFGVAKPPEFPQSRQAEQNEHVKGCESKPTARQRPEHSTASSSNIDSPSRDHGGDTGCKTDDGANDYLLWGEAPAQWVMAITSGLSVIIAALAVALVWLTLREARRTTKAAIRSVVQARRASIAAEKMADASREIGHRQLRAYVSFFAIGVKLRNAQNVVTASVAIKNFGQTPAYDYRGWVEIDIQPAHPATSDIVLNEKRISRSLLPPDNPRTYTVNHPVTDPEHFAEQIRAGTVFVIVYGAFDYRDFSGNLQTGEFASVSGGLADDGSILMVAHSEGNTGS